MTQIIDGKGFSQATRTTGWKNSQTKGRELRLTVPGFGGYFGWGQSLLARFTFVTRNVQAIATWASKWSCTCWRPLLKRNCWSWLPNTTKIQHVGFGTVILPKHIDEEAVLLAIDPEKDVDGFHPLNMGRAGLVTQSWDSFNSSRDYGDVSWAWVDLERCRYWSFKYRQ